VKLVKKKFKPLTAGEKCDMIMSARGHDPELQELRWLIQDLEDKVESLELQIEEMQYNDDGR
jgi:hypothetical protein